MSTIHLTDAQRDTFAACGLIVIDGERMPWIVEAKQNAKGAWCVYVNGSFISDHAGHEGARWSAQQIHKAGPPDLSTRAPEGWRILTELCDTCGGMGTIASDNAGSFFIGQDVRPPCPNPDCVGGRRVVTLTATCPDCDGSGFLPGAQIGCCDCDPAGVVTLGRFTIPALWQVDRSTDPLDDDFIRKLVSIFPLPRPGQFIARPEEVT